MLKTNQLQWGVAICGAAIFLATLLPWASPDTSEMVPMEGMPGGMAEAMRDAIVANMPSVSGTDMDAGILILLLGLAAAAGGGLLATGKYAAMNLKAKPLVLATLGCLALAALLVLINMFHSAYSTHYGRAFGIWLAFLASFGGTAMAFLLAKPHLAALTAGGSGAADASPPPPAAPGPGDGDPSAGV